MEKRTNKGFSLVELIIVIAIMSILAAGIAPALIRYINKARKADDIAAAESLGTTINAAINSDDDVYFEKKIKPKNEPREIPVIAAPIAIGIEAAFASASLTHLIPKT